MAPRVLILSAAVGAGHLRAAQALELALKQMIPDIRLKNIDVLTMTNSVFRRIYGTAYLDLVNHAPHVLGYLYDWMDRPRRPKYPPDRVRLLLEKLNMTKFMDMLENGHWDVIVNTHFLSAEIIAYLRKKGVLQTPQVTVTTDFDTHRLWVNQPCERYTTATAEGAKYLSSYGVPPEHLFVTGIPIHPQFAVKHSRDAIIEHHKLATDRPIVLQLTGGFGVGPVAQILNSILAVSMPLQVIAVAGKNPKAKKQLEAVHVPRRHRVKVFGYTDKIEELMTLADMVITKPGGLTTSEVLACGTPMAILNPIPGQESRNSDYLLENGAGVKINNLPTLPMKLEAVMGDPAKMKWLRDNARRLGRPRAAFDVAQIVLDSARVDRSALVHA